MNMKLHVYTLQVVASRLFDEATRERDFRNKAYSLSQDVNDPLVKMYDIRIAAYDEAHARVSNLIPSDTKTSWIHSNYN